MAAMGSLDIRWPIGFIFTIYGVILLAFGGFTGQGMVELPSGPVNVDLIWGAGFLVFGVIMGGLALRTSRRDRG